jgi:hypothetical protein
LICSSSKGDLTGHRLQLVARDPGIAARGGQRGVELGGGLLGLHDGLARHLDHPLGGLEAEEALDHPLHGLAEGLHRIGRLVGILAHRLQVPAQRRDLRLEFDDQLPDDRH